MHNEEKVKTIEESKFVLAVDLCYLNCQFVQIVNCRVQSLRMTLYSTPVKIIILLTSGLLAVSQGFVFKQFVVQQHGIISKRDFSKNVVSSFGQSRSHLAMVPIVETIFEPYTRSLEQYPALTKATTGFVLCGVADIIAQVRSIRLRYSEVESESPLTSPLALWKNLNTQRLARFATKGFFGAMIWGTWYDLSDDFLSTNNIVSVLSQFGIQTNAATNSPIINAFRTVTAIIIEQFVACPIIFGLWEIPAATLLNNSPPTKIPYEVQDKLGNMLLANAKVWTVANVILYNIPVQYRVGFANVIDIFWQSIVSDFAADCGGPDEEILMEESTEENLSVLELGKPLLVTEEVYVTESTP